MFFVSGFSPAIAACTAWLRREGSRPSSSAVLCCQLFRPGKYSAPGAAALVAAPAEEPRPKVSSAQVRPIRVARNIAVLRSGQQFIADWVQLRSHDASAGHALRFSLPRDTTALR